MKNTDLMEALGEVPEDLVINALHPADDTAVIPSEREQIIMTDDTKKKSRLRIWTRGGIAAAIVGVLIAGNIALLHGLGKIGRSNSSETETTESTVTTFTETTTQTTETTTETTVTETTADPNKVTVPSFYGMDYDEAVRLAESCGLILALDEYAFCQPPSTIAEQSPYPENTVDKGTVISVTLEPPYFEFDSKGKPVRIVYTENPFDPSYVYPAHILTDGQFEFQTRGNSLYRTDNDQLIVTVEEPQQYLYESYRNCQTTVEFVSIQAVGTDWYLITSIIRYFDNIVDGDTEHWTFEYGPSFWYNRKTGKSELATYTLKRSDPVLRENWKEYFGDDSNSTTCFFECYSRADAPVVAPDGSGVYYPNRFIHPDGIIIYVPTPGNGKVRTYDTGGKNLYKVIPLENGNVIFSANSPQFGVALKEPYILPSDKQSGLFELDTKTGSIRPIRQGIDIDLLPFRNNKIYCILRSTEITEGKKQPDPAFDYENVRYHSELAEYLPESRSFRTVSDLDGIDWEVGCTEISDEAVILHPIFDTYWQMPNLLVSLKDGKITELK